MTRHLKRNYKRNQPIPARIVADNMLWELSGAKFNKRRDGSMFVVYREVLL